MGDWHQDLVIKNVSEDDLDKVAGIIIEYLIRTKIIRSEQAENVLGSVKGYCPGENWRVAVEDPDEDYFLGLKTNGLEVRKGRTVFYADGLEFEIIECPNCRENNIDCDWGELFSLWIENPKSADLECKKCGVSNSISTYRFEPKWELSNLGFIFWNWPALTKTFISKLEAAIESKIEKVEGKL